MLSYIGKKKTSLSFERTQSLQEEEIESHFKKWEYLFEEWEIERENILNFDETGFRIGCMNRRYIWVVQQEAEKRVYLNDPCNREPVTVIFAINATGKRSPPIIVMATPLVKEKHLDGSLPDNSVLATSDSGYTLDRLTYQWLQLINNFCPPNKKGCRRVLIIDEHGSHETEEFIDFCWTNETTPFKLPAHSTHILQSLDVGVFIPFKEAHQTRLINRVNF